MRKLVVSEYAEQVALCDYLNLNKILFYAVPNGGSRNIIEAAKLKRSGVKKGVPDLCIPVPLNGYHGLYIELKRKSGSSVAVDQQTWLKTLNSLGYKAEVAKGCDEAIKVIEQYFKKT